ncbi:nuclear transport factor 2 family protein [Cohnella sp. 56]|uniref:nuclear transport factor 2 family protein n=1 Tax=Cohnella sp. 56 TaxID=3113722 RepID=UPI0030E76830
MSEDKNKQAVETVQAYIAAYNCFDIDGMLALAADDVVFRNIVNGKTELETRGVQALRELAVRSAEWFESRRQTVTQIVGNADGTRIEAQIDYEAKLAVDLSPEAKAGRVLRLAGRSVFELRDDGKLVVLEDYS